MGLSPKARQILRVSFSALLLMSQLALVLFAGGCGRARVKEMEPEPAPQVVAETTSFSREELREALNGFLESTITDVRYASAELDKQFSTPQIRMTNMLWKVRSSQAYHTILQLDDPADALVEAWGLCVRLRLYFESGEGRALYGQHQHVAVDVSRQNVAAIEDIAGMFLSDQVLAETRNQVYEFARAHPVTGTFAQLGLLMTEAGDWQREDISQEILAGVTQISQSASRLAEIVEKLPGRLGEETWLLIEQIEAKRASLQVAPEEANRTGQQLMLEDVQTSSAALDRAAEKVGEAADSMERAFEGIGQTATAWQDAADATRLLLEEYGKATGAADDGTQPAIRIEDYRHTAEAAAITAMELRALIADLRDLNKSGELAQYTSPARDLMNDATWRIAGLILAVFLLAALYRLTFGRTLRGSASRSGA